VFCVLWGLATIGITISEYPYWDSGFGTDFLEESAYPKLSDADKKILILRDGDRPLPPRFEDAIITSSPEIPRELRFSVSREASDEMLGAAIRNFTSLVVQERQRRIQTEAKQVWILFFGFGFGVPLLVYIAGKTVYWVYKGFVFKEER
jgi:hypothetical protein